MTRLGWRFGYGFERHMGYGVPEHVAACNGSADRYTARASPRSPPGLATLVACQDAEDPIQDLMIESLLPR